MSDAALCGGLREAVEEILATMFFVDCVPRANGRHGEELIAARVDFEGHLSGSLRLRISRRAAHLMAADFLGEEAPELPASRTVEVVSELANMICGAVLSRIESQTAFRLGVPLASVESGPVADPGGAGEVYQADLPGGSLWVSFGFGEGNA